MARANAAIEDVRAVAWRDLAKSITQPLNDSAGARSLSFRALASLSDPRHRSSVPGPPGACGGRPHPLRASSRDRCRGARGRSSRFGPRDESQSGAVGRDPTRRPSTCSTKFSTASPELQVGEVTLADADGQILASEPPANDAPSTLNARLGASQPLTTFAEKAGVLRIEAANGEDELATVRTLRAAARANGSHDADRRVA